MSEITQNPVERLAYGQLAVVPEWVRTLMREAEAAGVYHKGIVSRRQRGTAINADVYAHDEERGLAVIQVRECRFRPGRFSRVRKDYYLLGRTERGVVFAHPIESPVGAINRRQLAPEAAIRCVLCRVWRCEDEELDHIIRQGDVAFIPDLIPAGCVPVEGNHALLRETHRLVVQDGELLRAPDGTLYLRGRARMEHARGQHKPTRVRGGQWRVQEGLRADVWGHTVPTRD